MKNSTGNPTLSVVIITWNEEKNIARCLDSLAPLRKAFSRVEVLVVDALSRDRTAFLAKAKGAQVFLRPWKGYSDQKNWGFTRAKGDWVLSLDADEALTPELAGEIGRAAASAPADLAGFWIKRRAFFLGKWIRHCGWWPDPQLRFFRRGSGKFADRPVHEGLEVRGRTKVLSRPMDHHTYESLSSYLEKLDRYTDLNLLQVKAKKIRHWRPYLVLAPCLTFLRLFILKLGFLDGWHGFVLCALSGYHEFSKGAKVWEKKVLQWEPWSPK